MSEIQLRQLDEIISDTHDEIMDMITSQKATGLMRSLKYALSSYKDILLKPVGWKEKCLAPINIRLLVKEKSGNVTIAIKYEDGTWGEDDQCGSEIKVVSYMEIPE